MNDQQNRRLASNEAVFRRVNERLLALNEVFDALGEDATFVCECCRLDCIDEIEMSLAEYATIRADPRRFFVAPSEEHVSATIERIVERTDRYFVVEKIGVAAAVATRSQLT